MTGRRRPASLSLLIHDVSEIRSRQGRLPSQPSSTVAMPGGCALTGDAMDGGTVLWQLQTRGWGCEARGRGLTLADRCRCWWEELAKKVCEGF